MEKILLISMAVLILASNYIPMDKVKQFFVSKNPFKKKDKAVDATTYSLVNSVSMFVNLRESLVAGKKEEAVEKLDEVFPLMNEE